MEEVETSFKQLNSGCISASAPLCPLLFIVLSFHLLGTALHRLGHLGTPALGYACIKPTSSWPGAGSCPETTFLMGLTPQLPFPCPKSVPSLPKSSTMLYIASSSLKCCRNRKGEWEEFTRRLIQTRTWLCARAAKFPQFPRGIIIPWKSLSLPDSRSTLIP